MKVLILTRSYPNFNRSATTLCTKRLIDCMAKQSDFEVHCLCYQLNGEKLEDNIGGINIVRVEKTPWMVLLGLLEKQPKIQNILLKIQKLITIFFFPCIDPFMYLRYKTCANNLVQSNNYDIIIAEHHGYITLMTGYALKTKYPNIKYYPVLWDPILGQTKPAFLPHWYVDKRILECENKVNYAADKIFSIKAAERIYENYTDTAGNKRFFFDIPSILPPISASPTEYQSLIKKGKINIIFSGLLGVPNRDPKYIVSLMNMTSMAEQINLLFFSRGLKESEKDAMQKSFKGNIVFHNYIPLNDLYSIYSQSDYLLNISHTNANMTPSKIFEYMSYGKPIISVFITEGDAAKQYLDQYPESLVIDQKCNKDVNIRSLEIFLSKKHENVSFDVVRELFPMNTPDKFVEILRSLN